MKRPTYLKQKAGGELGQTLAELLIGITIFMTMAAMTAVTLQKALEGSLRGNKRIIADELAHERVEEWKAIPFDSIEPQMNLLIFNPQFSSLTGLITSVTITPLVVNGQDNLREYFGSGWLSSPTPVPPYAMSVTYTATYPSMPLSCPAGYAAASNFPSPALTPGSKINYWYSGPTATAGTPGTISLTVTGPPGGFEGLLQVYMFDVERYDRQQDLYINDLLQQSYLPWNLYYYQPNTGTAATLQGALFTKLLSGNDTVNGSFNITIKQTGTPNWLVQTIDDGTYMANQWQGTDVSSGTVTVTNEGPFTDNSIQPLYFENFEGNSWASTQFSKGVSGYITPTAIYGSYSLGGATGSSNSSFFPTTITSTVGTGTWFNANTYYSIDFVYEFYGGTYNAGEALYFYLYSPTGGSASRVGTTVLKPNTDSESPKPSIKNVTLTTGPYGDYQAYFLLVTKTAQVLIDDFSIRQATSASIQPSSNGTDDMMNRVVIGKKLKLDYTITGGYKYCYVRIADPYSSPVIIPYGTFLEYDIYIPYSNSGGTDNVQFTGGIDLFDLSGGGNNQSNALRDASPYLWDQNHVPIHPSTDLEGYAKGKWYHRIIPLTDEYGPGNPTQDFTGQSISWLCTAVDGSVAGTNGGYTSYFKDIKLTDGQGGDIVNLFTPQGSGQTSDANIPATGSTTADSNSHGWWKDNPPDAMGTVTLVGSHPASASMTLTYDTSQDFGNFYACDVFLRKGTNVTLTLSGSGSTATVPTSGTALQDSWVTVTTTATTADFATGENITLTFGNLSASSWNLQNFNFFVDQLRVGRNPGNPGNPNCVLSLIDLSVMGNSNDPYSSAEPLVPSDTYWNALGGTHPGYRLKTMISATNTTPPGYNVTVEVYDDKTQVKLASDTDSVSR